jgi:hypothetical protein
LLDHMIVLFLLRSPIQISSCQSCPWYCHPCGKGRIGRNVAS